MRGGDGRLAASVGDGERSSQLREDWESLYRVVGVAD